MKKFSKYSLIVILILILPVLAVGVIVKINQKQAIERMIEATKASYACSYEKQNIHIPTVEEFYQSYPYKFDFAMAKEKGLTDSVDEVSEMYIKVSSLYRKALEPYLLDKCGLAKYDRELADSELNFLPVKDENKNLYHKWSSLECDYIYLRNNVHVERLSQEDIDLLLQRINNEKYKIDNQFLGMVDRTYNEVIWIKDFVDTKDIYQVTYQPGGSSKWADKDAIVFEISHARNLDENGEWINIDNEASKAKWLSRLAEQLSDDISQKSGIQVFMFCEKEV